MEQIKHTPGEWTVIKPEEFDANQVEDRLVVRENEHIAEVFQYRNEQNHNADGVALANARLIAAAPELLGALKMIVEVFNLDSYATDTGGGKCYTKAQIAIAKAEGK